MRLEPEVAARVRLWEKDLKALSQAWDEAFVERGMPYFEPWTFEHGSWLPESFSGLSEDEVIELLSAESERPWWRTWPEGWAKVRDGATGFLHWRRVS